MEFGIAGILGTIAVLYDSRDLPAPFALFFGGVFIIGSVLLVSYAVKQHNYFIVLLAFLPFYCGFFLMCSASGLFGKFPHIAPLTSLNSRSENVVIESHAMV